MKDRLKKNLGLKIISLLIAIIIWLFIVNVQNPITKKTFEDIPVTRIHVEAISEIDKVFTVKDGDKVDITVKGRKLFVDSLSKSDLSAVADLSKISDTNAAYIEISCTKPTSTSYELSLGSTKMMLIELENKVDKKLPVEVRLAGEVDSGYYISEKIASPNMIMVSGAESVVKNIKTVVVEVNVQDRTSTFQEVDLKNEFKVYDNNDDIIDNSKLEFNIDAITINIAIQRTKEVELKIVPVGKPANGYQLAEDGFEYEPRVITVSGDKEALDALTEIPYEFDISGRYEDFEENLMLSEKLLNVFKSYGVTPVDDTQTIAISVKFDKLETREISFRSDDIDVRNLAADHKVEFNTPVMSALVQGRADKINNLSAADLKPYIDLSEYEDGTTLVNVQFPSNGDYEVINLPTINITLTEELQGNVTPVVQ